MIEQKQQRGGAVRIWVQGVAPSGTLSGLPSAGVVHKADAAVAEGGEVVVLDICDVCVYIYMGLYFFRVAGQEGLSTGYDSQV